MFPGCFFEWPCRPGKNRNDHILNHRNEPTRGTRNPGFEHEINDADCTAHPGPPPDPRPACVGIWTGTLWVLSALGQVTYGRFPPAPLGRNRLLGNRSRGFAPAPPRAVAWPTVGGQWTAARRIKTSTMAPGCLLARRERAGSTRFEPLEWPNSRWRPQDATPSLRQSFHAQSDRAKSVVALPPPRWIVLDIAGAGPVEPWYRVLAIRDHHAPCLPLR
jgi:hypothetical protein